ncbi:site-specific integrase [Massilia arenosa]|uniref:Site-specific integrase n=1 Tax=Zemynaea arenosa TaxID=2561931 RepID=A0A4Y9S7M1_9BURK|nr:site-specific integrase [Massilia arenosa]TFW16040.1 site-specific integrase [Massilia arenosa]
MARLLNKLSAVIVKRLSTPGRYNDGQGLWLNVTHRGTKSWVFRYAIEGKRRELGLGSVNDVPLAAARKRVLDLRAQLRDGLDPLAERRKQALQRQTERARTMSFDACAAAYIAAHRAAWRNPKHTQQWSNTLATYASPVFGALPVAEVDTRLVVSVLEPIWYDKTETAKRLRGRIEAILDWAAVSGFRSGENPARWKGHLSNLLAAPTRIAPVVNHPALPWKQVPTFMAELKKKRGITARALEFTIHTAVRSNEVRAARWEEIDLDARLWTIPAHRMKALKEHWVPLSDAALAILTALPHRDGLVFEGRRGKRMSDMSLTAVMRRMGYGDFKVHGFRSSFRDWAAEEPSHNFSRELCEHALAHKLPDAVEAAYQRGTMLDKRKVLMAAWSQFLDQA